MKKKTMIIISLLLAAGLLGGCAGVRPNTDGAATEAPAATESVEAEASAAAVSAPEEPIEIGEVQSSGASAEAGEQTLTLSDAEGSVRITEAGTYRVSGSLSDGQIVVDAPEDAKVKLILDGVQISCAGGAAICAISADKLILSAAEGSVNVLSSTGEFVQTDDNKVDACVFAKCDLTLNGDGSLGIRCESGHGVVSKDDLKIKSGTISVESALQGLSGKDSLTIEGGTISIVSGTDGLHSEHDDAGKGYIELLGGSCLIQSGSDGADASGTILLQGAALTISAGLNGDGGKGLKADADITIESGTLNVTAQDDAIHAGGCVIVAGGELELSTADDGIHADSELLIEGGSVSVLRSYEGLEAQVITINGGTIRITASDDGLNAAGGNDGSNAWGPWGGDPFASDGNASLTINGGTLTVNAEGDGLDSNGKLIVTGGEICVSGPTNGGNGALDYGSEASVSGGVVIAAGSAGMAENFGSASTQGSILLNVGNQSAGSTVTVTAADGTVLASWSPEKSYQTVVVSAPGLTLGSTVTVTAGSFSETVTLSSLIVGSGMGFGGGPGGGPGRRR